MNISVSHIDTTRETKLIGGTTGKEVIKRGYSLEDPNLWPLDLVTTVDGVLLKLQANCPNGKEFTLRVNGDDFQRIPYLTSKIVEDIV